MLQTVMQVSTPSRITSYSISFHPASDRSTRTWPIRLAPRPADAICARECRSRAIPPPVPPSVYAGRITTGYPIAWAWVPASSTDRAIALSGTGSPSWVMASRNNSRSSARRIASRGVPKRRTPSRSRAPDSARATARLRPVCPPIVARIPCGRSRSRMRVRNSTVSGSMYTRSAVSTSVMIVAGLLLTSTTSTPSSESDRQAWLPE